MAPPNRPYPIHRFARIDDTVWSVGRPRVTPGPRRRLCDMTTNERTDKVVLTDAEWRERLDPER